MRYKDILRQNTNKAGSDNSILCKSINSVTQFIAA